MNIEKLQETLDRAKVILTAIDPHENEFCNVELRNGEAHITYFPEGKRIRSAVRLALDLFGKLDKQQSGGVMEGTKDGVTLKLFGVLKCEVIDTKIERRPKLIDSGETEEIKIPVYRCTSPLVRE